MKILITGVAGFIGFHLSRCLIKNNIDVIGIDNINDYYDINLKKNRLKILKSENLNFRKIDIADKEKIDLLFKRERPSYVIHLAAQAGVRYSITNPYQYIDANIIGFQNIIENCIKFDVKHFFYASSSSVYGLNKKVPFSEDDRTDNPANLYGASKKSNELVAFSYSHLYSLPTTGLRFFTVYGPWGRPDMAYFKFTKNILNEQPINVFGNGKMYRDFTYIDDVVIAIRKLLDFTLSENSYNKIKKSSSEIYNIGCNKPVHIKKFIRVIEDSIKIKAIKNYLPMQMGDIYKTYANINKIKKIIDFKPTTNIEKGLPIFIDWYKDFYK